MHVHLDGIPVNCVPNLHDKLVLIFLCCVLLSRIFQACRPTTTERCKKWWIFSSPDKLLSANIGWCYSKWHYAISSIKKCDQVREFCHCFLLLLLLLRISLSVI